ncbi:hypothetical protein L6452_34970 [Arctium lappa]|uniref:Uncharacterized protein n=1 Tax=Arctium lappa TaxID=4217 RepID=A0ACB8YKQ8_ARCLA|nr:hypothetical protein L6452_34970 [Arctium lappa]
MAGDPMIAEVLASSTPPTKVFNMEPNHALVEKEVRADVINDVSDSMQKKEDCVSKPGKEGVGNEGRQSVFDRLKPSGTTDLQYRDVSILTKPMDYAKGKELIDVELGCGAKEGLEELTVDDEGAARADDVTEGVVNGLLQNNNGPNGGLVGTSGSGLNTGVTPKIIPTQEQPPNLTAVTEVNVGSKPLKGILKTANRGVGESMTVHGIKNLSSKKDGGPSASKKVSS